MTKERQQEIALLLIKEQLREKGINIKEFKEYLEENAEIIEEIDKKEAMEFTKAVTRELVDEAFSTSFLSLYKR